MTDISPVYGSLGSLIIDDIVYEDGTKETNILGGAGIYAVYGSFLVLHFFFEMK